MTNITEPSLFDEFAPTYDASFSDRPPAQCLRACVYEAISPLISRGSRVLELGCGTGIDAAWLASRGCQVWATDASQPMLDLSARRAAALGLEKLITHVQIDLNRADAGESSLPDGFDFVFSNFGVLNCLDNLEAVFDMARRKLKPGGLIATTVMGRFCLSETLYFLSRGQITRAVRRWNGRATFASHGDRVTVWYHSPARLSGFAEGFEKHSLLGIGAFIPISEAFHLCERFPRAFGVLNRLEVALGKRLPRISDHYLLVLKKVAS